TKYPTGASLFFEEQEPRGVFIICEGRVKLSTSSREGKVLITRIALPGELIGLSATMSGQPYEFTPDTLEPTVVNLVKRDDFLRFLENHGAACLRVAEHLSRDYHIAHHQSQSLGLSGSVEAKLARLLLDMAASDGRETERGIQLKLALTHEELA